MVDVILICCGIKILSISHVMYYIQFLIKPFDIAFSMKVRDLKLTGKYTTLHRRIFMKGKFCARLQNIYIDTEIAIDSNHPKLKTLEVCKSVLAKPNNFKA